MDTKTKVYFKTLIHLIQNISVSGKAGKPSNLQSGLDKAIGLIKACGRRGGKLIFIGNGASASISSHMASDFWKNGKIKAISFNDAALLTCVSNDFGYKHVFEIPIETFADRGDVLIAISSSGKSENVIRGAGMARSKGCDVITLSGFDKNNPLRSLGDVNFYVSASSYGQVEVVHHSICHCMLDTIVSRSNKGKAK